MRQGNGQATPGADRQLPRDERGPPAAQLGCAVVVREDRALVGDPVDIRRAVAHRPRLQALRFHNPMSSPHTTTMFGRVPGGVAIALIVQQHPERPQPKARTYDTLCVNP